MFIFTGRGAQYLNMGRDLYECEHVFKEAMDMCDNAYWSETGESLLSLMYPDAGSVGSDQPSLDDTQYAQPALFALEWSLSQLWASKGIKPSLVLEHSIGEIAAVCVAGMVSMQDGMKMATMRGRLMQSLHNQLWHGRIAVQRRESQKSDRCHRIHRIHRPQSLCVHSQMDS